MSSDSYRKSSISHCSSIERSKQRQLYFQEERTPFITVAVSSPTDFSGAAIEMHDNRLRTQAQSPSLMEFGPYEDGGVKERRKLPFEVQWKLNFWERFLAAPVINSIAFENQDSIPRFHEMLDRLKEVRHTFVHRKEPPVLYLEHMLADSIELTTIIWDQIRTHKLDQMYQMVHYMASLLRDQISNETKTILEDRLQAGRQEIEIKRDLTHDTEGFEALYDNALQALEEMMQPLTDTFTDD
ncbi:hypothetical protein ACHAO8_003387 [Botrytis cinerea]